MPWVGLLSVIVIFSDHTHLSLDILTSIKQKCSLQNSGFQWWGIDIIYMPASGKCDINNYLNIFIIDMFEELQGEFT